MGPTPPERCGLSSRARYAVGGATGCLGFACLVCASLFVVAAVPDVVGLTFSIIAAAVPALVYVLAVIRLDRYEREPASVLLGAFFWGSVVAVVLAVFLESLAALLTTAVFGPQAATVMLTVVGAPVAEEMSKGLALLLLYFLLKNEFDDTLDGIVYGSVVGLGFAMTENIVYFGQQFMRAGVGALAEIFVFRIVLAGLAHALYTGTAGAGLGYAREITDKLRKVVIPLGAFLLSVVQHLLWNGTLQVLGNLLPDRGSFLDLVTVVALMSLIFSGPVLLVLLTIVVLTWRRERRIIAEHLIEEVESGVVTPEDYRVLSSGRRRARATYGSLFSRGIVYWYYLRRLYQAEVKLAFAKWHASQEGRAGQGRVASPEEQVRAQIEGLRTKLRAL